MSRILLILLLAAGFAAPALAQPLLLAPGKTITVLDSADPTMRLILTAPPNAPLDLEPLMRMSKDESLHSFATRLQLEQARGLAQAADGTIVLQGGQAPQAGRLVQGGTLVFNQGNWRLIENRQAAASAPEGAPAPAQPHVVEPRVTVSKPGVSAAQAGQDIAECRQFAVRAANQVSLRRIEDQASRYHSAMQSCLRGFGYELHIAAPG